MHSAGFSANLVTKLLITPPLPAKHRRDGGEFMISLED